MLFAAYDSDAADDSMLVMRAELQSQKRVDSALFQKYSNLCISAGKYDELISNYHIMLDSAKKDLMREDMVMLTTMCRKVDTTKPSENTVYLFYITGKLFTRYHLDNTSALNYFLTSVRLAERFNDPCLIIKGYSGLGSFYMNVKHDIVIANEYFEKIDSLLLKTNMNGISECNVDVNISHAVIYYYMGNYAIGCVFLDKSIVTARKLNLPQKLFDLYIRRANFETELGDRAKALRSLDTLEQIISRESNKEGLTQLINSYRFNIAVQEGRYDDAKRLSEIVVAQTLNGTNDEYYDYLYHLSKMYIYFKDYKEAEKNIAVYESSLKPWNIQRWRCVYENKYLLNKARGNFGEALENYERYTRLNDSVHHQQQIFAVIAEQIKFHTKQKEEQLNLQIAVNETQSKNIKLIVLFFITVCLALLLLLGYRINRELKEKEKANRVFAQKLLQNTEQAQNRLAHELHDGLGQELLLLKNGLVQDGNKAKVEMVADIIESVRGMARELYPALLDVVGLKTAIENQLQKIDDTEKIFVSAEIDFSGRLTKHAELQVYRIFQEAITNVIKYAKASSVLVILREEQGMVGLVVKDNGVGFDTEIVLQGAATFGLQTMRQRAESINGQLKINSIKEKGTEVSLVFSYHENIDS